MSSKTKSKSNTTMTYGQTAPINSPDIEAARTAASQDIGADPSINYQFARRKAEADNSFSNPFGANVAPETMEAMKYARQGDLSNEHGAALSADWYRRKQGRTQNLLALAGMTAPRTVQTGGSSTGSVSTPIWPGLLSGGISAGLGMAGV